MNRLKTIVLICVLACGIVSTSVSVRGIELVATASADNTVKLWDLNGTCLATLDGHLKGASVRGFKGIRSVAFNHSGRRIVTAASDSTAKLWSVRRGKCLKTFRGHEDFVLSAAFDSTGKRIITASADGTVRLWNCKGECLTTYQPLLFNKYKTTVFSAAFSPNPGKFQDLSVITLEEGEVRLMLDYGQSHPDLGFYLPPSFFTLQGHSTKVFSAVFNPTGDRILTASSDRTAKLWNQSACCTTFSGHSDGVTFAVFNCNCDHVATASRDKTAKLWNLDGACLTTFVGHSDEVWSVAFNSTGDRILTASSDGTAKLWDLDGNCLVTFQGHSKKVYSAVFSPTS